MNEILKIIRERQSARVPFDPNRPISKDELKQIFEAARWTPTAHNMQNFDVIIIDDKAVLERIGKIKSRISEEFLRENFDQLSFSKEELLKKKTGILAAMFPPDWGDPKKIAEVAQKTEPMPLTQSIRGSTTLLIVTYDSTKRAPASRGDILGFLSLGCLMENIWLMAQSLGIGLQILSTFSAPPVETEIKKLLGIPEHMKIAYTCRLGYPAGTSKYLRVRRDIEDFTHNNRYGNKGL
ncbi:MAG TPA: nitroreductase family protein [Candidatus Acidoferrum sp.]|nr:nitroreductase family protein [Candidatus Acidoferrum sp.]